MSFGEGLSLHRCDLPLTDGGDIFAVINTGIKCGDSLRVRLK